MRRITSSPWFAPGLLLVACAGMALAGLRRDLLHIITLLYAVAFVLMLIAWRYDARLNRAWWLLLWAVLFRVVFLPVVPDLSDDFYRYVWDGVLTADGVNPYEYKPSDPALHEYAQRFPFERLNSPDYHTVYAPLSQAVFALGGLTFGRWGVVGAFIVIKCVFVLMELAGVALMLAAARRIGLPVRNVALYAWNPLAIIAVAGNGHTEAGLVFGFGLMMLGATAARRYGPALAWSGLALAGMAKLVPFLGAPLLMKRFGWRGVWAGAIVTLALPAPFWYGDFIANYLTSLRLYVQSFEFNAGVYEVLKALGYAVTWHDQSKVIGPALAAVFVIAAVWMSLRIAVRDAAGLARAMLLLMTAWLLCSTTVHPWYALAALVLCPFTPVLRGAWLWFSAAAVVTYFYYGPWGWPHIAVSGVVWTGFLFFAWRQHGGALVDAELRRRGGAKAKQIEPHVRGRRVLDLGCGEGYVAAALQRRAPSDEAPGLVLCDVECLNRTHLPFVRYDGRRLPFADNAFDTVVLSLVLHHSADPHRVLAEAARVCRGRIIVTESVYENRFDLRLIHFLDRRANRLRAGAMRRQEKNLRFRTVPRWRRQFVRAGLRPVETRWLNRFIHKHVLFVLEKR